MSDQSSRNDQRQGTRGFRREAIERRWAAVSLGLFLALLALLAFGPGKPAIDTKWAIPTAMSFVRGSAGDISEYVGTTGLQAIKAYGDRRYNFFPIGSALLSVPIVAIVALVDPGFNESLKHFDNNRAEKIIGSIFGALAGAVFFWVIYLQFRNATIAIAGVFVLMFCTSMWSTATRALWDHAPLVLMIAIMMLLLLRARDRPALAQYASLPLAMAFIIRPSAAAPIVAVSLYVLCAHRAYFIKYLAWAATIAVPWIAFNLWSFGVPFPDFYFHLRWSDGLPLWLGLAVQLVSPGRGLFVFSPVLLFAIGGYALAIRSRQDLGLHLAFGVAVLLHLLIVAPYHTWWAGWSYGPRFMTDVVPYLVYYFSFTLRAIVPVDNFRKAAIAVTIGVFAVASAIIHARGAYSGATDRWNALPVDVDRNPARIWDWRDLQFTRGISFINPEPRDGSAAK